jgi:imidazolonepropionase
MRETAPDRPRPRVDLLISDALEVVTCVPAGDDLLGRRRGVGVAVAGERILGIAPLAELSQHFETAGAQRLSVPGRIVAPGFVDSHTHLVFGGSRAREYAARMTHSAEDLTALGIPSGILATVEMTRAEDELSLIASARRRLDQMLRHGTTTVESKSGYGLSLADELKILQVNRALAAYQPVDIVSTFLGAHAFPRDVPRHVYLETLVEEMIPRVGADRLAIFCDVYCDEGYYSVEESRRVLAAGMKAGLRPKIHVDAYAALGGAEMAADLGVVSADHLNYTDQRAMTRLAHAGATGVGLPGLDFAVAHPRPFSARAILEAGLPLALATDLCPACWVESMPWVLQLACRSYGLSPEEALFAATAGGARALGLLADRGTLEAGKLADLQVWDVSSVDDIIYRLGRNPVDVVIKRGRVIDLDVPGGRVSGSESFPPRQEGASPGAEARGH